MAGGSGNGFGGIGLGRVGVTMSANSSVDCKMKSIARHWRMLVLFLLMVIEYHISALIGIRNVSAIHDGDFP